MIKRKTIPWENSFYYRSIIVPIRKNLYPSMPLPESYGITVNVLEEYLKKLKGVEDRFSYGEDDFRGYAFKNCLYFGWIVCVVLGLLLGNIWGLFLGVGIVALIFFIACRIHDNRYETAISAIKIPAFEKYIEDVFKWRHENHIS